jgi:hypothetical protein
VPLQRRAPFANELKLLSRAVYSENIAHFGTSSLSRDLGSRVGALLVDDVHLARRAGQARMLEVPLNQLRIARLAEEPRRHPVPEVVDPKVRHGHPIPAAVMAMRLPFSNRPAWLRLAIVGTLGACARLAAASTMAVDAVTTSSFVARSLADLSYPASRRGALAGDGMLPVRTVKLATRLVAVEYRGGTFRCFVEKDAFSALPPPAPSQISIRNQRKPFNPLFPHAH